MSETYTVQRSSLAWLARAAVWRPMVGLRGKPDDLRVVALRKVWRRAVLNLHDAGLSSLLGQRLRLHLNCYPSGIRANQLSKRCCAAYLCPFCYGRYVQDAAKGMLSIVSGQDDEGLRLVGYRGQLVVTTHNPVGALSRLVSGCHDVHKHVLAALCSDGASTLTTFEPLSSSQWLVSYRGLLCTGLMPDADSSPFKSNTVKHTIYQSSSSSRTEVVKMTARVFRYPRRLLLASPLQLAQFLRARAGHRLSAAYGLMRSSAGSGPVR